MDEKSARTYFPKRAGLFRWQVWFTYYPLQIDEANGAYQWQASAVKHWRRLNALREADALTMAYNDGRS